MKSTNSTAFNSKRIPVKDWPEHSLHASETILFSNTCDPEMPTSPMHSQDFTIVLDRFKIDTWLLESVKSHLDAILPYLLKGSEYTWQELLGEDYMADLTMPRHVATLCLRHLAALPNAALIEQSYPGCAATRFQVAVTSNQSLS